MKFVVKYFSEITLKSKPVRRQFVTQLAQNVRAVLRAIDSDAVVHKSFDRLQIETPNEEEANVARIVDALSNAPGITYILEVLEAPLGELDAIVALVLPVYRERLQGKTFAVRCKRSGKHNFTSVDVERTVGGDLMRSSGAAGVDLRQPDVTVELEVTGDRLFVIRSRHRGQGGFPIGSIGQALSLISGGFDSPVASYLTMKRGMRTHFLFFNLGGQDHELGVREVALYLWQRYGCEQRVLFISVPFDEVVAELLNKVQDSQMGVILKRMMLRVGARLAQELEIDALVTGESVAQVSSQTLRNLAVIDQVTEQLVLRPLIATDKEDIVHTADRIGTGEFAAKMPEYCGVISVSPTTRAKLPRIVAEEARFDMAILDRALANARRTRVDQLASEELQRVDVEVLSVPLAGCIVIDIRHPGEEGLTPLAVPVEVLKIPFYELDSRAAALARDKVYMLYCGKGVMSRLHAGHLLSRTELSVKVFAP